MPNGSQITPIDFDPKLTSLEQKNVLTKKQSNTDDQKPNLVGYHCQSDTKIN